jgi:hypothetical protein
MNDGVIGAAAFEKPLFPMSLVIGDLDLVLKGIDLGEVRSVT